VATRLSKHTIISRGGARNSFVSRGQQIQVVWVAAGPASNLTKSLNLHDYHKCHRSTLIGLDPGSPGHPTSDHPRPPTKYRFRCADLKSQFVNRLTAECIVFVRANSTVVDAVTEEIVTYTLSAAGTPLKPCRTLPRR